MKKVRLVVASWCPACPAAKTFWKQLKSEASFDYEEIDIESEEGKALVTQHGIRSVPTALIDGQVAFSVSVPTKAEALAFLEGKPA